jgi:hypothetical protein
MYFDGTGDYLTIPAVPSYFLGTGDFTVECWYKSTGTTASNSLLVGWFPSNTPGVWGLKVHSTVVRFTYNVTGFVDITTTTNVVTDTLWHHIAVSRSGTNLYIFVDGTLVSTTTNVSASMGSTTQPLSIGFQTQDNTYLTGYIDDLRITKGKALYTANFTPPTQSLTL